MNNIEEKIEKIIKDIIGYDTAISKHTNLIDDLGITSIVLMELIYQLETDFDIQFSFDDLDIDNIVIFGNLVELISKKVEMENENG